MPVVPPPISHHACIIQRQQIRHRRRFISTWLTTTRQTPSTLIEIRGSVPGGTKVAAWVNGNRAAVQRVSRWRRTRVTAPKSERCRHAQRRPQSGTPPPAGRCAVDHHRHHVADCPNRQPGGVSLAAGVWLQGRRFLQSWGEPGCSCAPWVIPPYNAKRIHQRIDAAAQRCARWSIRRLAWW